MTSHRNWCWSLWALLAVVAVLAGIAPPAAQAAGEPEREPPLRLSDPLAGVVAGLEAAIPQRMREAGVPGLSIALIRDGQIVWSEGFGVANSLTQRPVDAQTGFEVASISKPVAAYVALRLVQQGVLSLDAPVTASLSEPWLPPSADADRITLHHLLTHSAGLTNEVSPLSKQMTFAPGETFSYSGVGLIYLQAVVEQATGRSLEQVARELVFEPLGMHSSNYVNRPTDRPALANGHCVLGPFLVRPVQLFAVLLLVLGLLATTVQRLRTGRWRLSWRGAAACYALAVVLGVLIAAGLMGAGARKWTLLSALWLVGLGLVLAGVGLGARPILRRLPRLRNQPAWQQRLTVLCLALCAIALLALSNPLVVPVPKGPSVPPNAAYSLRSTAEDLAAFLIELSRPQFLAPDLAAELRSPQVRVNADNSWGLGLGIQHSAQGDALWHGGSNRDFKSLMVIYPDAEFGVVVLTNGEGGWPVVQAVAQLALGGKARWSLAQQPPVAGE